MKRFGVMLDCSRNAVMKVDEIKNFASILKSFGYNMLQLYTEDTYEVEGEPYFGYLRGKYTTTELKEIISYCEEIGIEVIPCIQTLAHLNQIFRWEEYIPINDTADILLCENERTYTLIENMFKSLRKVFNSNIIHIGMDEAHMLGRGRFLDKYGYKKGFDIIKAHLEKVIEIAKKYNFEPIMWSDMFFRLANNGNYYPKDPIATEEAKASVPDGVGLVYWDYYHFDKEYYDKMMKAHFDLTDKVWFAGATGSCNGFVSVNEKAMQTMLPAMQSAKEFDIDNILITMWGDNGKECSYLSALPSLFAIKKFYDGVFDMDTIKIAFNSLTGEDFDDMLNLDLPNQIGGSKENEMNASKYMLYADPFLGFIDTTVIEGKGKEYGTFAKTLEKSKKNSKYSYIFDTKIALCKVLEIKYELGVKTRAIYKSKDKVALKILIENYQEVIDKLDEFYLKFKALWFKENKPHGFDVQDIRLGGLKQRLISCKDRLIGFLNGEIDKIDELEEELLCYHGNGKDFKKEPAYLNVWSKMVTPNVL